MRNFLSRDQRQDSANSLHSSSSKSTVSSLQTWYKKRKRNSVSPSPPPLQDHSVKGGYHMQSGRGSRGEERGFNCQRLRSASKGTGQSDLARDEAAVNDPHQNISTQIDQIQEMHPVERIISNCRSTRLGKRRSSMQLPEMLPPGEFTSKELRKPVELCKGISPMSVGRVYRPYPEPGIRVETRPRSHESVILTTRPLYSARHHSPLVTGRSYTVYFESELRLGSDEDNTQLVLGFVAKTDHAPRTPGMERGSIGISFRSGALHVGGHLLPNVLCKPIEQVGVGLTFSKADAIHTEEVDHDGHSPAVFSLPSVDIKLFLTQNGKEVGSWNLNELENASNMTFTALKGNHDLYAAVRTLKEVNVDVFFDKRDWKYPKIAK